jgi:iron complex outermembrane receptor protein
VLSYFFETLIPLSDNFELTIAGRSDDYSDYGDDFSPKISGRWQASDTLVVRGSWGEGFRAPGLDLITALTSFSADTVADPPSCLTFGLPPDCREQITAFRIANPSLSSEQSEQYSFGFAWAPNDWFNGTLDFWDIAIDERINFFSSQELINRTNAGRPIPPGLGVTRDAATGAIDFINTGFGNEGDLETSGFDINARFSFDVGAGRFTSNIQYSQVLDYSIDKGVDEVGDPGIPEFRSVISNVYELGDFSFGWNISTIADQCDLLGCPAGDVGVPTWTQNDVQVNYFTPWDGRITVGAQNVTNKEPPIGVGDAGSRDYDFDLYPGYGRIVYFRYRQTF